MIKITLSPEAQAVAHRMTGPTLLEAVRGALDYENELSIGHIQATKLSKRGPNTLGVITNRLRGTITKAKAKIENGRVMSAIGSNVVYAGVHEFGMQARVTISEHTRRMTHFFGKPLLETKRVTVRSHSRMMKMPERAYIRKGVAERVQAYSQTISQRIIDAFDGGDTLEFIGGRTPAPVRV